MTSERQPHFGTETPPRGHPNSVDATTSRGLTFASVRHGTDPPLNGGGVEFVSVPEWCRRVGCSLDAGYRAARRNEIAGLFRIGRLMRINWGAFVAATSGAVEGPRSGW